jgi:cytoskeleton protein RodZ
VRQVEALEENAYEQLPGPVFVRGFVRNYARFLGLDPEPLLAYAEHHMPRQRPVDEPFSPAHAVPFSGERENHLSRYMIVIVLLIAGVLVFELYHYQPQRAVEKSLFESGRLREAPPPAQRSAAVAAAPATAPAVTSAPQPASTAAAGASPAATESAAAAGDAATAADQASDAAIPGTAASATAEAAAAPQSSSTTAADAASQTPAPATAAAAAATQAALPSGEKQLHLVFHKDSWVEVHDSDGKRIFSKLNPAGTEQTITGTPPFSLVIGNAAGVTLTYNGQPVDLAPHTKTTVARFTLE